MLFFYDVTNKHLIEEIQRFLIKNEKKKLVKIKQLVWT